MRFSGAAVREEVSGNLERWMFLSPLLPIYRFTAETRGQSCKVEAWTFTVHSESLRAYWYGTGSKRKITNMIFSICIQQEEAFGTLRKGKRALFNFFFFHPTEDRRLFAKKTKKTYHYGHLSSIRKNGWALNDTNLQLFLLLIQRQGGFSSKWIKHELILTFPPLLRGFSLPVYCFWRRRSRDKQRNVLVCFFKALRGLNTEAKNAVITAVYRTILEPRS